MIVKRTSHVHALVGIDKPTDMSSNAVLGRLKYLCHEKKAGHGGTLDPLATGVMVVGLGAATKLLHYALADEKAYEVVLKLGFETDTDDAEGQVISESPVDSSCFDQMWLNQLLMSFRGGIEQVPPVYSAIHVDGKRAYDLARQGREVTLASRAVEIFSLEIVACSPEAQTLTLRAQVSKGTYIRSLVRDIGKALGCGAYVQQLRRLQSGRVYLDQCMTLSEIEEASKFHTTLRVLDPRDVLNCSWCEISERELEDVRCGRALPARELYGSYDSTSQDHVQPIALCYHGRLAGLRKEVGCKLLPLVTFPELVEMECVVPW